MIELLEFIFGGFWTFFGFLWIFSIAAAATAHALANFSLVKINHYHQGEENEEEKEENE